MFGKLLRLCNNKLGFVLASIFSLITLSLSTTIMSLIDRQPLLVRKSFTVLQNTLLLSIPLLLMLEK